MAGEVAALEPDAGPAEFNSDNQYTFPFHQAELEQIELLLTRNDDDEEVNSEEEDCDYGELFLFDDYNQDRIFSEFSSDEESDDGEEGNNHKEEWLPERPDTAPAPARRDEPRIPPGLKTPYDYFNLLFTEELLQDIVSATNKCAHNALSNTSFYYKWTRVNVEEIRQFLGLMIYMGIVRIGGITSYWKNKWFYPQFAVLYMRRNRFLAIFRFLKFGKENLNSLINHFNNTMSTLLVPGTDLLISESLVLRKGIGEVEHVIRGNRDSYGVELTTLETPSGVAVRMHMCQGRRDAEAIGFNRRDKLVFQLMEKFLNAGHHLLLPDYFTSVSLANSLLKNNTHLTGHLRKHRAHNPEIVVKRKLKKGESVYSYTRNGVCVCKWRSRHQSTLMISTKWSPTPVPVIRKGRKIVRKPEMVALFDELLDRFVYDDAKEDPTYEYYAFEFKAMRWYKKVGIHIFQIMISNAYNLCKTQNNLNMDYCSYRKRVVEKLLSIVRSDSSGSPAESMDGSDGANTSSLECDSSLLASESNSSEETEDY